MTRLVVKHLGRLAVALLLTYASAARAQEPSDGTPPPEPAPDAPQAEDREAPPMGPTHGKRAVEVAPPAPEPERKPEPKPVPKPAPVKSEPGAPATPPRLTVHAYEDAANPGAADILEGAIGEELAGDTRMHFVGVHDLLEPPEVAPRGLGEADLDAVDADDAMAQGDADKAKTLLEKALTTYQKFLPMLAARGGAMDPFRDAWIKLARARFFDGDQKGARDAMRYVFVIDPSVKWDPKLFPAPMKKVVVESRLLFDTLGAGTLSIDSDPPGATVYLNGKKLDKPTPIETVQAPAGPNYISFQRRGWMPVTAIFEVTGGAEPVSAVRALDHYPGRPLQPLFRAQKDLDKPEAPATLKDGAAKLGVDMIILVRADKTETGTKLTGYLYDARMGRILKRVEKLTSDDQLAPAAHELAREVTSGVRFDGVYLVPVAPKPPSETMSEKMHRFRHWKGFWYVVGGVAGVVVIGAVVGIGVAAGGHQGLSPGVQVVLIGGR